MNKYVLFLLGFLAIHSVSLVAQDDFNSIFAEALRLEEERFNRFAGEYWLELHGIEPENANVNYRLGISYLNSNTKKFEALQYLKLIQKNQLSNNYDYYSPEEKNAPIEALYYTGHAYHLNNELDSAIAFFEEFKAMISDKHFLAAEADHQIKMCNDARYQFANPKDFTITNLGPEINTEFAEFGPVSSLDETALFFSSNRIRQDSSNRNSVNLRYGNYYDDVYVSYRDPETKTFGKPELLSFNDVETNTATINVSPDGQQLFIYIEKQGEGGVYSTKLIGETWAEPEKFGSDINSSAWETHVALSADGKTLVFVSDRKNGVGMRDLYRSVKLPNGEWSKALNLGEGVNSVWDEEAPFMHPDGKTLYFSSKGHNSMGGFDIFYTTLQEDGSWSAPENVGYPVNTTDDDIFFVTTADGKRAYFSSSRPGGFGHEDIYLIGLPKNVTQGLAVLKGNIYPEEGKSLPQDLYIEVTNIETGEIKEYKPRLRDGGYVIILPPCQEYEINYLRGTHSVHKENYFVPCESSYQEISKELFLNPVEVSDEPIVVEADTSKKDQKPIGTRTDKELVANYQVNFGYNKTTLKSSADDFNQFMKDLMAALTVNEYVEVTIEGSASKVPTQTFETNDNLARKRALDAEKQLLKAMNERGIMKNKVRIIALNSLTQGPDYNFDAVEKADEYRKYQYVIIKAYR